MNKHNLKSGLLFAVSTAFALVFAVIFLSGFFAIHVNAETTATTTPPSEIPPPPSSGGGGGGSLNNPPTISYSPDTRYINDGINPDGGQTNTNFTFKIVYTDLDNNPPTRIRTVVFDGSPSDSPAIEVSSDVMTLDSSASATLRDGNYTSGEQYALTKSFPAGIYRYRWEWSDGKIPECGSSLCYFISDGIAGGKEQRFIVTFIGPPSPKTAIGQIDPNKPTIVITHGLQDNNYNEVSADGSFDELFSGFSAVRGQEGAGYLIKQQLGNSVNVIQFVWPQAFQGFSVSGYQAALPYADDAGIALAKFLTEKLGTTYHQPIHFIGHSLGTVVNAFAAKSFLEGAPDVPKAQVTILDYPNRTTIAGFGGTPVPQNFFAILLQSIQNKKDLKIDNYYSLSTLAFGNTAQGQIYNHKKLVSPGAVGGLIFTKEDNGLFSPDHTGVHQWYRWTTNPEGFNNTNYCDNADPAKFNAPAHVSISLDPCQEGWYWSLFGQGGWNEFPTNQIGAPIVINEGVQLPLGDPLKFGCTYSAGVIICREQSSPYVIFDVAIPEGAEFLSFDYRFPNIGDGDYVSVLLDDEPLWILAGSSAFNPSEFTNSGPVPLPQDLAAGTHKLTIALFGVGEKNAEFELKNIQTNKTEEHTARSLKELVVQNLTDVKTGEKKTDKKIDIVIKHILESLGADLWKDDSHLNFPKGAKVFAKEVGAVAFMDAMLRQDDKKENKDEDTIPDSVKHAFGLAISDLLSADRMLAEVSLQGARVKIIDDQKKRERIEKMIKKAEDAMLGAEEVANKEPTKAVIRYGKAWFFSQTAIKMTDKDFAVPSLPAALSKDE